MQVCSQRNADPFYLTSERNLDKTVIQSALDRTLLHPGQLQECVNWGDVDDPLDMARSDTSRAKRRRRLGIALFGGAFLIGPMWLMVLHNTLYTCLISTTVFVTVFGVIMAFTLDNDQDVLASTAAYAAVLVVFVGLNIGS